MASATFNDFMASTVELFDSSSSWVEICFLAFFLLGFASFRNQKQRPAAGETKLRKKVVEPVVVNSPVFDEDASRMMEEASAAGEAAKILLAWRSCCMRAPTPSHQVSIVVQALLKESPASAVAELVEHIRMHASHLCNPRTSVIMLDVAARSGDVRAMEEMCESLRNDLSIPFNVYTYEVILGGYAAVGDEDRVESLLAEMHKAKITVSARAHSLIIKGFLKSWKCDAVLAQMDAMQKQGFTVPPFATTQLCRVACEKGEGERIFDKMVSKSVVNLSEECIGSLLDWCVKCGNKELAARVEGAARARNVPLNAWACQSLLRIAVASADTRALDFFQEMLAHGHITSGQSVMLLSSCAEVKFLRLAEEIVAHVRSTSSMTIATYSALMKVYAYCSMYNKACDLYEEIIGAGLEPDAAMYGCLLKFSVECGRTELSRKLAERSPTLDIQGYMSLIRAASRDKDVDAAFKVLERLKASEVAVDLAVYNCVLDVCVNAGALDRACKLIEEMKISHPLDIITYNTLLKGYCRSDLARAILLLDEMRAGGVKPNDVSYNSLINAAVNSGNVNEAWRLVESMEADEVKVDQFTVSIFMKNLRRTKNPKDLNRALKLLDRVDVCSDEVLLNSVLEACIMNKEHQRIEACLLAFESSKLCPAVHTYGVLIRAAGEIKDCAKCWRLWNHMIESKGAAPNEVVLGCMLDALASNGEVDKAEELMNSLKGQVKPNSVMYSTLVKGFSVRQDAASALRLWHQCRGEGVEMNNISYNCIIDSQARVGAMTQVSSIFSTMEKDGCRPDTITYCTVVKGYCNVGQLQKALEFFQFMQQQGMVKDAVIYNTLLDGCARHGHLNLAEALVEDMEKRKIQPSHFTVGILVRMFSRAGDLDKAIKYANEWSVKHQLPMNSMVMTSLVSGCLQHRAVDKALKIFAEMKANGRADSKSYSALTTGLHRVGEHELSRSFAAEAAAARLTDTEPQPKKQPASGPRGGGAKRAGRTA